MTCYPFITAGSDGSATVLFRETIRNSLRMEMYNPEDLFHLSFTSACFLGFFPPRVYSRLKDHQIAKLQGPIWLPSLNSHSTCNLFDRCAESVQFYLVPGWWNVSDRSRLRLWAFHAKGCSVQHASGDSDQPGLSNRTHFGIHCRHAERMGYIGFAGFSSVPVSIVDFALLFVFG